MPQNPFAVTPRAVLYVRTSTDDQAELGTGADLQEHDCRRVAETIGAAVVEVCADDGVSGTLYPRPGIERALDLLETGEADILIAYNPARLGRRLIVTLTIHERLLLAGARLFLCDIGEVTEENAFMLHVSGSFAQIDHSSIVKRMKAGKRARARDQKKQVARSIQQYGLHAKTHADAILGLYPELEAGEYAIVPDQARIVAEIFARYHAGASLRSICYYLHEQGVRSPGNMDWWSVTQVRRLLLAPIYKGLAAYGKTATRRVKTGEVCDGKPVRRTIRTNLPQSEWELLPCPAIVTEELWEAVNAKIGRSRAENSGRRDRKHVLGNLVRCPACGARMRGHTVHRPNGAADFYYHCAESSTVGRVGAATCAYNSHHDGNKIEDLVRHAVFVVANGGRDESGRTIPGMAEAGACMIDAALSAYRSCDGPKYDAAEHKRLTSRISDLDAREKRLVGAMEGALAAGASTEPFFATFGEIKAERDRTSRVLEEMAKAAGAVQAVNHDVADVFLIRKALADLSTVLASPQITPAEKHDLISALVESITPSSEPIAKRNFFGGRAGARGGSTRVAHEYRIRLRSSMFGKALTVTPIEVVVTVSGEVSVRVTHALAA